jgi:glycosyltransferase involved in cell wall biosynthesis
MSKTRILYILRQYPQISETYIQSEMDALKDDYDLKIISRLKIEGRNTSYIGHLPYSTIQDGNEIVSIIRSFKPHVLHTHWAINTLSVAQFARHCNIPFTVRAHSFDTIPTPGSVAEQWIKSEKKVLADVTKDELCLGVLAFPFSRPLLERCGVPSHKIHDCFPVVNVDRFLDRSENGDDVMNTGACIPKKRMQDFLTLGSKVKTRKFRLYPVSYNVADFVKLNEDMGKPVEIVPPVEPVNMAPEYKKHQWMVYTACPKLRSVGWPLSIAEAQASGVGVVLANVRPDMKQYIGDAGFLYDDLEHASRIISQPVPEEIRERGFEQAKLSDINQHKTLLTNLWPKQA